MSTPVLLSRSLDPILGVFTGVFAFYLHQTNPRTAPRAGETFKDLVYWKKEKWVTSRSEKLREDNERELEATLVNLLKEDENARHR